MLTKEYRICLPMSVEEYRIAQLYMIQKKSREESSGSGSGVEILTNEPYKDGPGGCGQYTHKIYHIGSHLPGWFKAVLPKSALMVEEQAWNAYPYTKTIYKCPFIERFTIEIETRYCNDGGEQENIFSLSGSELRNRTVDYLDIVQDPISSGDYKKEEDPKLYVSEKTHRGPLTENWREEYSKEWRETKNKDKCIMCAYKLCKVEFKYWGMQSKIERFIHDVGLRKTMLRAHRQAWAWQDEYHGLTIEDIRELEKQTQLALQAKYKETEENNENHSNQPTPTPVQLPKGDTIDLESSPKVETKVTRNIDRESISSLSSGRKESWGSTKSKHFHGPKAGLPGWHLESMERLQTDSSDDDEFFDAQEDNDWDGDKMTGMYRSSSMEIIGANQSEDEGVEPTQGNKEEENPFEKRVENYKQLQAMGNYHSIDMSLPNSPTVNTTPSTHTCKTTILFMIIHGGSIMDSGQEYHGSKLSDLGTFRSTLDTVIKAHYSAIHGHVAVRMVSCPTICAEALQLLASLNPFSYDTSSPRAVEANVVTNEHLPLGAISLFATGSHEYYEYVVQVINKANSVYSDFLKSEDGLGFSGQVCLVGDSIGSILGYDALCKNNPFVSSRSCASSRYGSHEALHENGHLEEAEHKKPDLETTKKVSISNPDLTGDPCHGKGDESKKQNNLAPTPVPHLRQSSCPNSRRTSTGSQSELGKFDFEVTDFFMLGSPLGLVLAYRKMCMATDKTHPLPKPSCNQIYNLFYVSDPSAIRMEPLLQDKMKFVGPFKCPRYQKFPLGDGQSVHIVETIQSNAAIFMDNSASDHPALERRSSNMSIASQISGQGELTVTNIASITNKWWGIKRLDYALYCPDALQSFPTTALPYLLHASFWESTDVVAFILRQVVRSEFLNMQPEGAKFGAEFKPAQPREKWLKRRTTIKLRNVAPNHRANDVIVLEDKPQTLTGRFMYGPLDMVSLSGEKFDVHVMTKPPSGEYVFFGTDVTDGNGRAVFTIPDDKKLSQGMYPCKMVVRGDHTATDFYLAVLPPKTETVVFSIDGSFTASVSIMGKDPKVRAGAVDVVRHWQELGYLIVYVTARPDMQQKKVVAWLAQHNFPHGMVAFMDGLSADPLRQKANYLKQLKSDAKIQVSAAYGSSKDISVYQALGLESNQIFVVGKASKKHYKEAIVLAQGYASHLNELTSRGGSRPASGNARMFLRKSCFSLPGQHKLSHKKSIRKTASLPYSKCTAGGHSREGVRHESVDTIQVTHDGTTVIEASSDSSVSRARGLSPRGKAPQFRYDSTNI